jgi:hypothetical protein
MAAASGVVEVAVLQGTGGFARWLAGDAASWMLKAAVVAAVAGVVRKLSLKGVGGFAVSPDQDAPLLAAYVPESKGVPGYVGIWRLDQLSRGDSPPPVARRSFFRASPTTCLKSH